MEKIKNLDWYQKGLLIAMAGMVLVFSLLYPRTLNRVGFAYKDQILLCSREEGNTVYSGKLQGQEASFTVSADKTVFFRWGEKTYGPYTAKEDPTAIPEEDAQAGSMTGVELRCGEDVIFRGGVLDFGDFRWLYNQDGTVENLMASISAVNGMVYDANGERIDPMEPSAATILDLMAGPELTHKGDGTGWLLGVCLCVAGAVSILFAEELFRWNLSFQIRNAEGAEPSDWELTSRYIGWTVVAFGGLFLFLQGLQ